jgi:hypothetical protein
MGTHNGNHKRTGHAPAGAPAAIFWRIMLLHAASSATAGRCTTAVTMRIYVYSSPWVEPVVHARRRALGCNMREA